MSPEPVDQNRIRSTLNELQRQECPTWRAWLELAGGSGETPDSGSGVTGFRVRSHVLTRPNPQQGTKCRQIAQK